jgi:hypothetical protein
LLQEQKSVISSASERSCILIRIGEKISRRKLEMTIASYSL